LSIHSPFPQDSFPSGHTGSSVLRMGITFLGSEDQHSTAVICWVTSQLPLYILLLCGLLNEAFNGSDLTAFTDRNVSTQFMWKNVVGRGPCLVRAAVLNCGRRVWGQSQKLMWVAVTSRWDMNPKTHTWAKHECYLLNLATFGDILWQTTSPSWCPKLWDPHSSPVYFRSDTGRLSII
jgi:hypothetical protein